MAEKWRPYLCNVNGKIASIFVDLALAEMAPIRSKPLLLWSWVDFLTPRPDGLSDGREAPILYKIEDALNLSVSRDCRAIPCGRITTEGRREFYFYGESDRGFDKAVETALKGFDGYVANSGSRHDPEWEQYFDVLYPSDDDIQRIANGDVLDTLTNQGDVLTVERNVDHWLYFPSELCREQFRNVATTAGYGVRSESRSEGELPFCIVVFRVQSVEQSSIDHTVLELLHLSQRFEGEYDGWETQVKTH